VSLLDTATSALGAIGTVGLDDAGTQDTGEHITELSGSRGYLADILNRQRGSEPVQKQADPEDKWEKRLADIEARHNSHYEQMRAEVERREADQRNFMKELFNGLSSRPITVEARQPQQAEPLPTVEVQDPDMAAALNAYERRFDMKHQQMQNQFVQALTQRDLSLATRDIDQAIKRAKSAWSDFGTYFNEKQVREDAINLIRSNPAASIDWDKELQLGYDARRAPAVTKELEELRKYKEEAEKAKSAQQKRQKQNLDRVPTLGGRGGERQGSGLIADSIIADSRKAGKRLSWKQFGSEVKNRLRAV
jgi:hypothetical protein